MNNILHTIKQFSERRLVFYLLFTSFSAAVLLLFFTTSLPSQADPYYHIAHAHHIWSGKEMSLPYISSITEIKPILWHFFHLFLAPFTAIFQDGYAGVIAGAKIGYAVLFSLFSVTFYYVSSHIIATVTQKSIGDNKIYGIVALSLLFASSPLFSYRLFLMRPHIISIFVISFVLLLIMKKRWWSLFIVSAIFPFVYSSSYLILIPSLAYILAAISYYYLRDEYHTPLQPLGISTGGLFFGVLIHPDTLDYVYNAFYIPLSSIAARFFTNLPLGAELYFPQLRHGEWVWLIPLTSIIGLVLIYIYDKKKIPESFSFTKWYLLVTASTYFGLFILISRAVEYLVPISILLLIVTLVDIIPTIKSIPDKISDEFPGVAKLLLQLSTKKTKAFLQKSIAVVIAILVVLNLTSVGIIIFKQPSFTLYQPASNLIKNIGNTYTSTVFHESWSHYPRLVFFNNTSKYLMGMGPGYTYFTHPKKYWLWYHLTHSRLVCAKEECTEKMSRDPYTVITKQFDADFIFLTDQDKDVATEKTLKHKIKNNRRFENIFMYTNNEKKISVYKVTKQ